MKEETSLVWGNDAILLEGRWSVQNKTVIQFKLASRKNLNQDWLSLAFSP